MENLYELAVISEDGEVLSRGGLKATKKTVLKWAKANNQNYPCVDGQHFAPVEASEDAITWKEYLALPWWER